MTRDEIKMAVEVLGKMSWIKEHWQDKHILNLISLAEGVLKLPEKKDDRCFNTEIVTESQILNRYYCEGYNDYRSEAMKALNIED